MGARRRRSLESLSDEELLDLRLCDLGLRIEGTPLRARVERLYGELARSGLRFRPYVWLSADWFTPDGVPGFAVPFFLAHPRLARLERRHMLEVEGGAYQWCMKLLRHETAHALDNAYGLHRRRRWRQLFGAFSTPYRATYLPRPTSRRYVLNLDYWYAQSHPCEDFAETFAVWLRPRSAWRRQYKGWPALKKLQYVDDLMAEIRDQPPALRGRGRPQALGSLRWTLREYYERKQSHYRDDHAEQYDAPLRRVFSSAAPLPGRRESAARFLARHRTALRRHVCAVTGQHPYLIRQVLNDLKLRCRQLRLRVHRPERDTLMEATALLTLLTRDYLSQPSEHRR